MNPDAYLGPAAAGRRRRKRQLVGVVALVALAVAFAWARLGQLAHTQEGAERRAAGALLDAVRGQPTAFAQAESAYLRAAKDAVLDPFPVFAAELSRHLAHDDPHTMPLADERLRPAILALAAGDVGRAQALHTALPPQAQRRLLGRLLDDLVAAAGARDAAGPVSP